MVRFKVIKGSHLLLGASVVILLAVALFIFLQSPSNDVPAASPANGAKVEQTFASVSSEEIRIDVIPDTTPIPRAGKSVLIYHTHTHEAYEQDSANPYKAIETWRTDDQKHSVVRLGSALADALRRYGLEVIHDTTDHEQNDLSNSYVRSLKTLESYDQKFDLYIDLHRDAYAEGMLPFLCSGDTEYAQLMLLVGRGDLHEPDAKPDYQGNLAFAQQLSSAMNSLVDGICRNVTVKKGRYNQHIGTPSILLEVGHNKNSLAQALNSIPVVAEAIVDIFSDENGQIT